jgi:hypothetical protein
MKGLVLKHSVARGSLNDSKACWASVLKPGGDSGDNTGELCFQSHVASQPYAWIGLRDLGSCAGTESAWALRLPLVAQPHQMPGQVDNTSNICCGLPGRSLQRY